MVARATSASAATAQRRVNGLVSEGLKAAQDLSGGEARATDYSVVPADDKRTTWTAQQTLELRGSDGPALLDLAGHLQDRGFAMDSLGWELSPAFRRKAHDDAMAGALRDLQLKVAAAAAVLGLRLDHLQDVRLDSGNLQPRRPMPMLAARAMVAPQETASSESVTADVSADAVLQP